MWRKTEDGAAAVEFAILLPVFVLLVLGMIEFGLVIWRQEILTNASREGQEPGLCRAIRGRQVTTSSPLSVSICPAPVLTRQY